MAQENEFNNLKKEITNAHVVTLYDTHKKLVLSLGASKLPVDAVIMHERNPIAYATASLIDCETSALRLKKSFLQYFLVAHVYQRIVETDHKPLVTLFNKPFRKIPARL